MTSIEKLKESEFQETLGVKKATFDKMLEELNKAHKILRTGKGRPNYKLSVVQKLIIALIYWREYRTMHSLAVEFSVSKNIIWKSVRWVENVLIKADFLHSEGKKTLLNPESEIDCVLIDVTEIEIERPQNRQKDYYSGKKKDIP